MQQPPDITVRDALEVMTLPPDFGMADLKRRYRAVSMRVHPDRGGDARLFQTVVDCYAVLLEDFHARTAVRGHMDLKEGYAEEDDRFRRGMTRPSAIVDAADFHRRFNEAFEKVRVPDPAETAGYGEWLGNVPSAPDNRLDPRRVRSNDTFNSEFEKHVPVQRNEKSIVVHPTAAVDAGGPRFSELGVSEVDDYEISCDNGLVGYDCKRAYSGERIADIRASEAPLDHYNEGRIMSARAADLARGLSAAESEAIRLHDARQGEVERARQANQRHMDARAAEAHRAANRLLLTQR